MPLCCNLTLGMDAGCQTGVAAGPLAKSGVVATVIEQAKPRETRAQQRWATKVLMVVKPPLCMYYPDGRLIA